MVVVVAGAGEVGGGRSDGGGVLHCGGADDPSVWVRDMVCVPVHLVDAGVLHHRVV